MNKQTPTIKLLISKEKMEAIVSSQRSITSEEFYRQVAIHTGKPTHHARKLVFVNGQRRWVAC